MEFLKIFPLWCYVILVGSGFLAGCIFGGWIVHEANHSPEMRQGETETDMWIRIARSNEEHRKKGIAQRLFNGNL